MGAAGERKMDTLADPTMLNKKATRDVNDIFLTRDRIH